MEETGWSNVIEYKVNLKKFSRRYNELVRVNDQNLSSINPLHRRKQYYVNNSKKDTNDGYLITDIEKNDLEVLEENLRIQDMEVIAMKMNTKGKYQKTNSAKKTDLIKVSFKLLQNDKVASGQKEIYVVLQDPKGKVAQAKGIFKLKDSEVEKKYTDHAILNYDKNDLNVTMFIQRRGNKFEEGIYPIKLFLEGELVAVTNLNLQNAF